MRIKEKTLRTTVLWVLLVASLAMSATGTTIDDAISSFTGTLRIVNPTTGTGLLIDQNGNGIGLTIDSEASTIAGQAIYHGGTGTSLFIRHETGLGNGQGIKIEQKSDGIGMEIENEGTGNGLLIDQNGNGIGLTIDSEATDGQYALLTQLPYENFAFGIVAESSVNTNSTMVLGGYYIWVDATGDLRIKSSAPTSDTDGAVVGAQS